ncbi:MAG: OsmC family protein [Armatimonadota bacterium]
MRVLGEQWVNGIDTAALRDSVGAIQETPDIAKFRFRARNVWMNGGHNCAIIDDFDGPNLEPNRHTHPFVHDADEPHVLGGTDVGANPVEALLYALSACITTALVYYASLKGIQLNSVESTLEGDLDVQGLLGLDPDVRPGFSEIRVEFRLEADEPRERLQMLLDLGQKFSPVFDMVTHETSVKVTLAE